MCFSAQVSFGASAVLAVSGAVAIKKAQGRAQFYFAAIPVLFAIQQFSEGLLWLTFSNSDFEPYSVVATKTFIFFAEAFWPLWVPLSIWMLEKNPQRKRILFSFFILGTVFSLYIIYCMFQFPVDAKVIGHHLRYYLDFHFIHRTIASVWYCIPTVMSCLVSSVKRMPALGITVGISFIIAKIFFEYFQLSVWCFFAAILSVQIVFILNSMNRLQEAGSGERIPKEFNGENQLKGRT
jgi:hypothetical protein